jgi:AcrR family transcriptional regulator
VKKAAAEADGGGALSYNLLGQKLGRKGRDTRARILAAAERVLERPGEAFTLSAVAREAGLRITSLYLYFADLSELLAALLDPVMESAEEAYVAQLREPWPDAELGPRCLSFVEAYYAFWMRHTRVLHLRNTFADGGDRLMWRYRLQGAGVVTALLIRQMGADPAADGMPAYFTAQALMIAIERMATTATDPRFRDIAAVAGQHRRPVVEPGAQTTGLIQAEAQIFELAIAHNRAAAEPLKLSPDAF